MEKCNVVIIGSGPAAYTAGIYAARFGIKIIICEGFSSGTVGGQLMETTIVENFPGFADGILGVDLMGQMKKQVEKLGSICYMEDVKEVNFVSHPYMVKTDNRDILTDAVIIATGAKAKRLYVEGTKDGQFWQKGVTACAVCDGAAPIFRGKDLFVIGGGDSAVEEALFLTKYAKMVFIVHRRDKMKASGVMAKKVMDHPKIKIIYNAELIRVEGDKVVRAVILEENGKEIRREAGGLFFAIGHQPNTDFLKGQLQLSDNGYIVVKGRSSLTSKEGVFAAGDVQDPVYKQAITAAGSGCMAAIDAYKWILEKGFVLL
jgi:thioredoxin reductase (NADPH)